MTVSIDNRLNFFGACDVFLYIGKYIGKALATGGIEYGDWRTRCLL